MRFGVGVGQGRRSPTGVFSPCFCQIPAEFRALLWSRILLVADLDSLQGGAIVYFARFSLGLKSGKSRRIGNVGLDWIARNGHLLST